MIDRESILQKFKEACKGGILAHAYIFAGPGGAGKRKTARAVAAEILGIDEERLPLHSDYIALERGGERGEKEIRIEEVRELKSRLALTSAFGGWRVAIIERVELLSREAASALLKVLEEPGKRTVLIMTADRLGAVLSTVRSRAVRILFPPSKKSSTEGLSAETKKELHAFFSELKAMPLGVRFRVSERYAKDATMLNGCIAYAADVARENLMQAALHKQAVGRAIAGARSLLRTDALLTHTNTNPRLAMDIFFMNLS